MQLGCPRCGHFLEYSRHPPRFCSNCGVPLSQCAAATQPAQDEPPPTGPIDELATMSFSRPRPADQPDSVGGYRLLRPLGGGGMGTVYEAEETASGRRVAVKLIRPDFADSLDAVERFRREGRLASTLQHPRCVFVLAADEEAGRPYIVMELMPGANLHDLLEQRGPLPVAEAVARILDVIEGLQEAHRVGVIHRDVKPSNCFLDAEGRVKVGDFGLAKSLIGPEHLTQSGAFLGTLLFASPEQIRNDQVNHLTDVYSVCATLYYLLTARAPFQDADSDAASTLARTVSDPLTSMRKRRRDLPATLDEIVLRGLARSRRQRWQSLEELRLALLPFTPGSHPPGEVGWRISAYLCDAVLLVPVELAVQRGLRPLRLDGSAHGPTGLLLASLLVSIGCGLLYFALPESLWGWTPGKLLMRLRVRTAATNDRPSLWRAGLRTVWFYLFKDVFVLGMTLVLLLPGVRFLESDRAITPHMVAMFTAVAVAPFLSAGLGTLLLAVSMRRRNGYRGLHEWLSGTKVIRLPGLRPRFGAPARTAWPESRGSLPNAGDAQAPLPPDIPARVGVFSVRAVALAEADERVLYGEDAALGRPVWLWLRRQETALSAGRRETARATRPRWLAGGRQDGWTWDAFVASPGCLLADLATRHRRPGWMDVLSVLDQLTDELLASSADGGLPPRLSVEQVWVQANGQVQLLDAPPRPGQVVATPLELLRQTAAVALEGRPRSGDNLHLPIRAPVPGPASELLARLMGGKAPFESLAEVKAALAEAHELPEEISRPARGLQVAVHALGVVPGLMMMFLLAPVLLLAAYSLCVIGQAFVEVELEAAEQRLTSACVEVVVRRDLPGKLAAAGWLGEEQRRRQEFRDRQPDLTRQRQTVLMSVSWFIQRRLGPLEAQFRQRYADLIRPHAEEDVDVEEEDTLESLGDELKLGPAPHAQTLLRDYPGMFALGTVAWPFLWCAWAAATRGGLGMRVAGVALVGKDGRPAARWRCACRALLVWLPVVSLLLASVLLDRWRVAEAVRGWSEDEVRAAAWLAWTTWWLALLLVLGYVWAAMRWPNGGLHDRLAGTYPVPR